MLNGWPRDCAEDQRSSRSFFGFQPGVLHPICVFQLQAEVFFPIRVSIALMVDIGTFFDEVFCQFKFAPAYSINQRRHTPVTFCIDFSTVDGDTVMQRSHGVPPSCQWMQLFWRFAERCCRWGLVGRDLPRNGAGP